MAEVVTKEKLTTLVAEKAQISKKDAKTAINAFIDVVQESVGKDSEVRLIGFGTFKKTVRAARKGRNPQTGKEIDIPETQSLSFKSSVKYGKH